MLPSFNANLSGWGLDFIWPTGISDWTRIAIIDAVTICHTRPVGGPNYGHLAASGKSPHEEMREVMAKHGLTAVEQPYMRGGIDKSDRQLSIHDGTARQLIERILVGYLPELGKYPEALMALVRPNLKYLGENAASIVPSAPVLKAS
jgi:hypothetical protein